MGDFIFNVSKGILRHYAAQAGVGNAALIALALATSGLESDAVLMDKDTIADVVAGTTNEVTNTNYTRKVITSGVQITVDDTNNRVDLDFGDLSWPDIATGDSWAKIIIAYDPDTTAGTDANLIPISAHDYVMTPDGSTLQATVNTFARAS
ncbi:MAG: hypothetical protein ACRDTG_28540 [Pseudonocardiaceae bacterium]